MLTTETASAYIVRVAGEPIQIVSAVLADFEGCAIVVVTFTARGFTFRAEVWSEGGALHGEWN